MEKEWVVWRENWEDKLEWTNNEEIEIDMSKIGRKDRKYDIKWRNGGENEIRMGQKRENWRRMRHKSEKMSQSAKKLDNIRTDLERNKGKMSSYGPKISQKRRKENF